MLPFSYQTVQNEDDAVSSAIAGGRYIAGGTTLIDLMREEIERPARLIDINALPLREVRIGPDGLVIGALARMSDVAADAFTVQAQPLIVEVPRENDDSATPAGPRRVSVWRGNSPDSTSCSAEFVTVPASQGGEATVRIIRC